MSQIVEGGFPAAVVTGAVIQELDTNKNVIFQWRSIDYIPITDSYRDITQKKFGYIHVNSVEFDPTDGNIILSCRETSEVVKISRMTGEVIWRMGGKKNEFTFVNEHEENAPRYFKLMHCVRRLANGNLTMFDNGADEAVGDQERAYSRAVEYALDEKNKTASLVWEYRNHPDIRTLTGGSVTRLSGGNTTINWGSAANAGQAPAMTEVDPNGQLVYDISPAQKGVTGQFNRIAWPPASLSTTVTGYEILEGNKYIFDNDDATTGVALKINSYEGDRYNSVDVTRNPFAPLFPAFPDKSPRVLPVRVTIAGRQISSIYADISFDAESFGFATRHGEFGYADPNKLTVHYRPFEGQGLFMPLPTYYNSVTRQLKSTMIGFGEFIFCFPDIAEVPYAPLLIEPSHQALLNQELAVDFSWTPRGFGRSYHLQVSTNADFNDLVVDKSDLTQTRYALDKVSPGTTYYWRVNTSNYGGTGEWATRSFSAAAPMIQVVTPNGGERWRRGIEYFIRWNDNLVENITIKLY